MLRGLFFNTNTAVLMKEHFAYDFGKFESHQKTLFKLVCKDVRRNGGNEVDACCVFMATMATSLEFPKEHTSLVLNWIEKWRLLMPKMTQQYAVEVDKAYDTMLGRLN